MRSTIGRIVRRLAVSLAGAAVAVLGTFGGADPAHAAPEERSVTSVTAPRDAATAMAWAARRALAQGTVVGLSQGDADRVMARGQSTDRRRTARWRSPLSGEPVVVRGFDPPAQRWLRGHRGVDLAGAVGEQVRAVEAGVVTHSGVVAGRGTITVTHADGLKSTYEPVGDRVPRGTRVARGDRIGTLGQTLAHAGVLHLGARRGKEVYLDPTPLLQPMELTLLPIAG